MTEFKLKSVHIDNFRKFENIDFDLGERISVISGVNGIGKSILLSLLAASTGTNDHKESGGFFQPIFYDFFKISPNEPFTDYKVYVAFNQEIEPNCYVTKNMRFANYKAFERGLRTLPETHSPLNSNMSEVEAKTKTKTMFNIGNTARVKIPTTYLSLSRILPMGEEKITEENIDNKSDEFFLKGYYDFYVDCYNKVLSHSIEKKGKEATKVTRSFTKEKYLNAKIIKTTTETQSVGQGNLSRIISAITNFYALKQKLGEKYTGGILCIDEVDATLHPSAINSLLDLLKEQAKKLNLQILFTTHSLIALKYIINLQEKDPKKYQLIYFTDSNRPRINKYSSYSSLKADLYQDNSLLSDNEVKVYCEDDDTKKILDLLLDVAVNLKIIPNKPNFKYVPIHLGNTNLINLPDYDDYFEKVLIVLDGDARIKTNIDNYKAMHDKKYQLCSGLNTRNDTRKNIVFLPGFFPPEIYLYNIITEYTEHSTNHLDFWDSLFDKPQNISYYTSGVSGTAHADFQISDDTKFDKIHTNKDNDKNWIDPVISFVKGADLLTDYYKDEKHKEKLKSFIKSLTTAKEMILHKISAQLFD